MKVIFTPEEHLYKTIEGDGPSEWLSVTSLLSHLKIPFDGPKTAVKSAKNKKSKWYGMTPEEILQAWENESTRAIDLGNWYHDQREQDLCGLDTIVRKGQEIKVFPPKFEDGVKVAPVQRLGDGLYPEHMVYLESLALIGQSDLVEIVDDVVDIGDYKTNKEIKENGYKHWDGRVEKMMFPVNHMEDCNLNHYNLQLSIYMYMILRHNPKLKPGRITIYHVKFEEAGRDKFDYPIAARDANGDPIVLDVITYELEYLKSEVHWIMDWLKENRQNIKKKTPATIAI